MTDDDATTAQERARQVTLRHGVPVTAAVGQEVLHVDHLRYLDVVDALRDDGFDMLVDLTAVDYLLRRDRPLPEGVPRARFEVVVNLLSMQERRRVRVRAQVPERHPVLPSLYSRFPAAEAAEREVFDMFGIGFEGHPDLTRILMPEDWDGHPLRKDYGVGTIPVQFKGAPRAR